ncbi:MAG: hypothetical protein NTX51_06785 [Verrucomicrobia bacterium]|nr:hypothetical protein [Verrucomicrobiota bacterium]
MLSAKSVVPTAVFRMKREYARSLLEHGLAELANTRRHLDYSFQQVAGLPDALEPATEKQLESAEAFTGRFARSVDLLVNKVLRALDRVELKPEGTLLDVVNRAEKRGLVEHAEELCEMKDVRNMIAHEADELMAIFTTMVSKLRKSGV